MWIPILLAAVIDLSPEAAARATANHLPAIQVAVGNSKALIANGAAGVAIEGRKIAVTNGDAFHIGSCTKPFTATVIATLVDEKKLDWSSTIVDVFPEFKGKIRSEYENVTVADLLSHESGLPPFGEDSEMAEIPNFPGDRTAHRLAFARWVLGRAPIALPKTAFHYSNAGYAVAAAISERVGKASWESLIQKRIFDRLGMKSAGFGWPSRVWGHTMGPDGRLIPVDPKGPYQLKDYIEPAGDLHMTAEDLLKFMQAHARAMRGQKTIISPAAAAVMHTKRIKSGLGFGVSSVAGLENVATHSGSADTFVTVMAFSAEHDVAVAVSTNSAAEGAEKVLGAMLKELLARYASKK